MIVLCINKIVKNLKRKSKIITITEHIISLQSKKLVRTIHSSIKKTKSYNWNKCHNNDEILHNTALTGSNNDKTKEIMIGDSMTKKTDGYLLTSSISHKISCENKTFFNSQTVDTFEYVKPIQRDLDSKVFVIHIGKNELTTDSNLNLEANVTHIDTNDLTTDKILHEIC